MLDVRIDGYSSEIAKIRYDRNDGFGHDVNDLCFEHIWVISLRVELLEASCQKPLRTTFFIHLIVFVHVVLLLFVKTRVCKMDKKLFCVLCIWFLIDFSCNSHKPFGTNICFHRIKPFHQNVDSAIEFSVIQKERIIHIMLNKELLRSSPSWNILNAVNEEDSFSSASFAGFGNVPHSRIVLHVFFKQVFLFRKQIRKRSELKLASKVLFHSIHDVAKDLLSHKQLRTRVSVYEDLRPASNNVNIGIS